MESMTSKFANAVLTKRKELGLTQEELAEKVGTSKQMVCRYEKGQRSPKVAMANAFAEALGTTLDELLDVEKYEQEKEKTSQSEFEKALIYAYSVADEWTKNAVKKLLDMKLGGETK